MQAKGHVDLFPLDVARALAAKMTLAVSFLHSAGYVHAGMSLIMGRIVLSTELRCKCRSQPR